MRCDRNWREAETYENSAQDLARDCLARIRRRHKRSLRKSQIAVCRFTASAVHRSAPPFIQSLRIAGLPGSSGTSASEAGLASRGGNRCSHVRFGICRLRSGEVPVARRENSFDHAKDIPPFLARPYTLASPSLLANPSDRCYKQPCDASSFQTFKGRAFENLEVLEKGRSKPICVRHISMIQ